MQQAYPSANISVLSLPPRRHTDKAKQEELVNEWRNSGLSKAEYCRKKGLRKKAFYNWTAPDKMQSQHSEMTNKAVDAKKFLSVKPEQPKSDDTLEPRATSLPTKQIEIHFVNGTKVLLPLPCNGQLLVDLLRGLACN